MNWIKSNNGKSHWAKDEHGTVFFFTTHYIDGTKSVSSNKTYNNYIRVRNMSEVRQAVISLQEQIKQEGMN